MFFLQKREPSSRGFVGVGFHLYEQFKQKGFKFKKFLADGRTSCDLIFSTEVPLIIGKRLKLIKFICLPNARGNRTLLDIDFLEENGIVLDLAQKTWFFKDAATNIFNFKTQEFTLNQVLIDKHKVFTNDVKVFSHGLINQIPTTIIIRLTN